MKALFIILVWVIFFTIWALAYSLKLDALLIFILCITIPFPVLPFLICGVISEYYDKKLHI
jgi:hypothetical protein